jgi:hypothetical protein
MKSLEASTQVEFASQDINEKHLRTFVFPGDRPAVPLLFSVEARAEELPPWDGPDYQFSAYPSLYFADGTCLQDRFLCFSPGTHDWERQELYLRPRLATKRICINYFFEHKAGRVAYRNALMEPVAARPEPDRRIVLLGDSNVLTSHLAQRDHVATLLQQRLAAARPDLKIEVENEGCNGESIKTLLERKRYERDILTLGNIHVAFIRYGYNDRKIYGAPEFERLQRELIRRLRADFPAIKIVLETGTFIDYPAHYNLDINPLMAPYHETTRRMATDVDGLVDVYARMQQETANGNWDFRYRNHPQWKLVLDGRFDAEHAFAPEYYSNPHHTLPCNRLIAQAEYDVLIQNRLL